jgi:hypothetical protein
MSEAGAGTTAPPIRREVERLKADWAADPCWDLEDTPGFEDFREELLDYATRTRAEWDRRYRESLEEFARTIGAPGNVVLAEYVRTLERRLAAVENRLDDVDH